MAQITLNSTGVASDGVLVLQSNGTTAAVTIDTSQRAAFVAGTAALPAITTTGDTNTGIFFPAADTIAFSEGGVEAMRIDSDGDVGIGTTSPGARLDVRTTSSTQATFTRTGQTAVCTLYQSSADTYLSATNSGASLILATQDTERMRILSTGNILSLSGGSTSATGTGITFPATQSASSDANTLDDYEEGTFTPTASGVTVNSGTPVYSGAYTKIGRIVFIRISQSGGDITLQGSGLSSFGGLPFTVASASTSNALWSDGSGKTGTVYAYEGSTLVYILQAISTFTNLTALRITATYQV